MVGLIVSFLDEYLSHTVIFRCQTCRKASILHFKEVRSCLTGYLIGRVELEPSRRIALTHRDIPKTEKFCMSGPVKFGEKSKNVKPPGNHAYYFLERLDHVKQDIRLVGLILSLLDE